MLSDRMICSLRLSLAVTVLAFLGGCGGGGSKVQPGSSPTPAPTATPTPSATPSATPSPTPTPTTSPSPTPTPTPSSVPGTGPAKPVITLGSTSVRVYQTTVASVTPQIGVSYEWTISGGTLVESGGESLVRFLRETAGSVTLTCKVTDANQLSATSDPLVVNVTDGPVKPVVLAPAFATANQTGLQASVENQAGCSFSWKVTGGTPTAGASTSALTFNAGGVGTLGLTCTATKNGISATSDTFSIQVSASAAAWKTPLQVSSLPPMQINLSSEGERQWIFANMLRTSEAWIFRDGMSAADAQTLAAQVQLDANGWPTSLPDGARMQMYAGYRTDDSHYLHGVYVLTWEGSGFVELQSTQNDGKDEVTLLNDQAHGRIVRLIQDSKKAVIVFVRSSDSTNPVRNMKLWAPAFDGAGLSLTASSDLSAGHVTGSLEPAPGNAEPMWHPRFLQHLAEAPNAGVLRFMGWLNINQSVWDRDSLAWSDRGNPAYALGSFQVIDGTYNRYPVQAYHQRLGMPYEWLIDLCNASGKDLWIQVPHVASQDLIRNLADLCATRLNAGLRVWFEYSNEIWNGINPYLAQQNKARAAAALHFGVGLDAVNGDQLAWGSGHLQGMALKIFEDEWRAQGMSDARLINVVAGFAQGAGYNQGVLNAVKEIDPKLPEALAITNYFGYGTQGDIFALQTFGANPGVWPAELYDKTQEIVRRNLYDTTNGWKACADVAKAAGVPMVAYEGGQHMLPMGLGDWNNPAHADFMRYNYAFQRSPQIHDLYLEHYALWRACGGATASLFVDTSSWSFFGYWGAKEFMVQDRTSSQKWDAFLSYGEQEAGVHAVSEPVGTRPVLPDLTLTGEAQLAYSQDIVATGGDGTVKLEVIGGELPPGLSFTQTSSGAARIAGTPTQDGLFRFVVRALDGDQDPDYKAYSLSIDPAGVASNALVVFRGSDIPGTPGNKTWVARFDSARASTEVQTAGVLTRTYIPFSMSAPLFDKEDLEVAGTPKVLAPTSPENMYGGWSLTSMATSGTPAISAFVGLRDHQFSAWTGDGNGGPTAFDGLLLWKTEQFNALGGSGAYSFGSDAAHAMLRVDLSAVCIDRNNLHFVVVNHDTGGDTFYLSEAAFTANVLGDGYFQLGAFSGSSEVGKRWAVFTPTADAYALPTNPAFAAKTFNDVRAVGLAFRIQRDGWHYAFAFPRFLALGQRN